MDKNTTKTTNPGTAPGAGRGASGAGAFMRYLSFMLRLALSPQNGWEDLDMDLTCRAVRVTRLYGYGFLPMTALCALSAFVRLAYAGNTGFLGALQSAIIWFTALFVGFHIAVFVLALSIKRLLPEGNGVETERLSLVAMFSVGMLGVVFLLTSVVKVHLVIIDVLPVYVVYVIWRSARFIGVEPRNEGLYTLLACGCTLAVVYLLVFLFDFLL